MPCGYQTIFSRQPSPPIRGLPEIIMSIEKGRHLAIATIDADPGEADTSFSSELDHFLSQSKQIVKQEAMKLAGWGQSMRRQTVRSGLLPVERRKEMNI